MLSSRTGGQTFPSSTPFLNEGGLKKVFAKTFFNPPSLRKGVEDGKVCPPVRDDSISVARFYRNITSLAHRIRPGRRNPTDGLHRLAVRKRLDGPHRHGVRPRRQALHHRGCGQTTYSQAR